MNHQIGAVIAALVVTAGVLPAAAVGAGTVSATDRTTGRDARATGSAYQGAHVEFLARDGAVSHYTVDGEVMVESVAVESAEHYRSRTGVGLGVGLDLTAVTTLEAAPLDVTARSETGATVRADSGATMRAHDNGHGILVVTAGNGSQVVKANLSAGAGAETEGEGDSRVVVTTEGGAKAAFVVVGDGDVTVNEEGDVTAHLAEDAKLVLRSYPDERDEDDRKQEELIAGGEAAAEVYVMADADGEGTVVDTVQYDGNTTVEARRTAGSTVEVTVGRTEHDGKVILASVSEASVGSVEDLRVAVDGEAAARASSYSELEAAADGGDRSKYVVVQETDAEAGARADVLVAVNHFSTRTIAVSGADSGTDGTTTDDGTDGGDGGVTDGTTTGGSGDDGGTTADGGDGGATDGTTAGSGDPGGSDGQPLPGFGPAVALVALVILAVAAVRYRRR